MPEKLHRIVQQLHGFIKFYKIGKAYADFYCGGHMEPGMRYATK